MDFLHSGAQPMSDRYMYFASIGLWMLVCWEACDSARQYPHGPAVVSALGVVLLAACCVASSMQLRYWRNEGTILSRIPESNYNPLGHADYAGYLFRRGQLAPAQAECEKAIAISPNFVPFPVLLGDILLAGGKTNQAVEKYQSALRLDHSSIMARLGLGRAYLAEHHVADAAAEFNAVLHDQPRNFEAHRWLAHTFQIQGKAAEAVAEFHASLNLQPNQPDTLNDLAWLLATDPHAEIRHGAEAVQLATRACALTLEQEPRLLGTLAAAYAETGDFDKAVAAGQKAHDIALAQGRKALAETNLQLLTLYRAHKPFREKQ
jgi:tetratricopeptide (TPR) repeat protein